MSDKALLQFIAQKTWDYFANTVDRTTGLPVDRIDLEGISRIHDFTSTTNIGMYVIACLAAEKMGFISAAEMSSRVTTIADTLDTLAAVHGLYYNYYHTTLRTPTTDFISSIDNGWLAIALAIATQRVDKTLAARLQAHIDAMNFKTFYNESLGQLNLGFNGKTDVRSSYDYGLLCSEARATSYFAIGKGDLPPEHWFRMYRTFPPDWDWQHKTPQGTERIYLGQHVFEGYYVYKGMTIVPSWGGSLFEFLMPALFMDEKDFGAKALGENDDRAVKSHIAFAKDHTMALWGLSPCATPDRSNNGYGEFGVPDIGAKGYSGEPVVAPYSTFLALQFDSDDALTNIKKMVYDYPGLLWEYGFFDAVDLRSSRVAKTYLCLDQAMILIALCNYLEDNYIQKLFNAHPYAEKSK